MSEEAPVVPEPRAAVARQVLRRHGINTGPWLTDFADSVLIAVEELEGGEILDDDRHFEIANEAVPVYTRELLETFREDIGLMRRESELTAPGASIEDAAKAVLFDLAMEIIQEHIED